MRADARRRQFRANALPTGVSVKQMAQKWEQEARINPASQGPVPAFNPSHWVKADWKTEEVRKLSRKGAEETRRLAKLDERMGHKRLVPQWVQASGVSLPITSDSGVAPPMDQAEPLAAGARRIIRRADRLLAALKELRAEVDAERSRMHQGSEAPLATHESSVEESHAQEERPLPDTKAVRDEESA